MRRAALLIAVMTVATLFSVGVALALNNIVCDGGVCQGTNMPDNMKGTRFIDKMYGRGGSDGMSGNRANDVMVGGSGFDTMYGSYGSDRIYGGTENDTIRGGPAHDRIEGGQGRDTLFGENGSDRIVAAGDRETDSIDCGLGTDTAIIDAVADLNGATLQDFINVTSCERVILR